MTDHLRQPPDARQPDRREGVVRRGDRVGAGLTGVAEQRPRRRRPVRRTPGAGTPVAVVPVGGPVEGSGPENDVVRRRVGRRRGRDDHRHGARVRRHGRRGHRPATPDLHRGVGDRDPGRGVPGQPVGARSEPAHRPPPDLPALVPTGGTGAVRATGAGSSARTGPGVGGTGTDQAEDDRAGQESDGPPSSDAHDFPRDECLPCRAPYSAAPAPSAVRVRRLVRRRAACGSAGR